MNSDYDVVIVGAGLVGLVLAALLVKHSLKVAIIETGTIASTHLDDEEYQLRVSAINRAGKDMFVDLGVWNSMQQSQRLSGFEKMFVWDSLGRGEISFDCTEIAEPCLGYIIENAVIYNALIEHLKNESNLTLLPNTKPIALAMLDQHIEIQLNRPAGIREIIKANLLVGADGAHSWVREKAAIETYSWPYNHQALVTTVAVESTHKKTAWQCFLPEGPLALLPLYKENICSIVWSAPPPAIMRLLEMKEREFNLEISGAFEYRLGNIQRISKMITIPLSMRHAKNYIAERVALVGDAAHTIHPLAGQGVNLGFADACALAEAIIVGKEVYHDCGHYLSLRKYERARKSDNWMMIFGMEFFKRLFQGGNLITRSLRRIGLNSVDRTKLIKDQFIYKALGR